MRVNLPREFSRVITHSTAEAQVSVLQAQREAFIHVPHMKAIQLGRTVKLHTWEKEEFLREPALRFR